MLKTEVLNAVKSVRTALEDLLMEVSVSVRTANPRVPGQATTYAEQILPMKMAITDFDESEIDGERVKATDKKGILFPDDGSVTVNDTVTDESGSYRVMRSKPTMVGNAIAIYTLQLRPT